MSTLLEVVDLHTYFRTRYGLVKANNGVSLSLAAHEALGVMGETGCGKTVLALSVVRFERPGIIHRGRILFRGMDLAASSEEELERLRGTEIGLVPQDPSTGFNPTLTVGEQLLEAIRVRQGKRRLRHEIGRLVSRDGSEAFDEAVSMLAAVGLPSPRDLMRRYPHELSGGMRQRALLGMAMLGRPKLLITDEPTTALDHATRELVVELLSSVRGRVAIMLISHDPDVVRALCDRVAVMYAGKLVEVAPSRKLFAEPLHPYTRGLLSSVPRRKKEKIPCIGGEPPNLARLPAGCAFHPRCDRSTDLCRRIEPPEVIVGDHTVRCHLYELAGAREEFGSRAVAAGW